MLTISGSYPPAYQGQDQITWHARSLPAGRFGCTLNLPHWVDADHVEARFEDGVLTLYLPKVEEARPKHIAIRTQGS